MHSSIRIRTVVLLAVLTGAAPAWALGVYDTFNGKRLDPALWDAWSSQGALDVRREVSGGRAYLSATAYGGTDTDTGRAAGRSVLPFPESIGALVTTIQVNVQARGVAIKECPANIDTGGRVLAPRVGGMWFNDGTCAAPPCVQGDGSNDMTGNIWSTIDARLQTSSTTPPGRVQITAYVGVCDDPDCNTTTDIGFESLGLVKLKKKKGITKFKMRMDWDADNDQFMFKLDKDAPVAIAYTGTDDATPAQGNFKRIEMRGQPQNCNTDDQTWARGEVRLLDVRANDEALQ